MFSGTPTVALYNEAQLVKQMYAPNSAAPYLFRIVQPTLGFFKGVTNADAYFLILNYGVQVVAEAFYVNDANLQSYERLFNKSAFLSLSDTIGTIKLAKG
jgi:hypothetical protein